MTGFTLPEGLTSISNGLFYNCTSLSELVIPQGVTVIEDEAFIAWNEALSLFSPRIKEIETRLKPFSQMLLFESMKVGLYLNYRTDQEFLPQLRENIKGFQHLLDRTVQALDEANNDQAT